MRYYFIDDSAATLGGAELTLSAIKEKNLNGIVNVATRDLHKHQVDEAAIYVLGNITQMMSMDHFKRIFDIMDTCVFVSIEFDYGYCKYRGPICHDYLSSQGPTPGSTCEETGCPLPDTPIGHQYQMIRDQAAHIFYMSRQQMEMHTQYLGNAKAPESVLSSCFDALTLNTLREGRENTKSMEYVIMSGVPGWHSIAKGVETARAYAEREEYSYKVVKTNTHAEMLQVLCSSYGLIFLPYIHDTCPRIAIEAKIAGGRVITNERAQHITEDWWTASPEEAEAYLRGRPDYFWETVRCLQ